MAAATGMMAWLEKQLAGARAAGGHVWMAHHIPLGIDPYSTAHSKAATCPAKARPLSEGARSARATSIGFSVDYADVVQASFSGHVHFDDYRLIGGRWRSGARCRQDRPGDQPDLRPEPWLHVFTYDRDDRRRRPISRRSTSPISTAPTAARGLATRIWFRQDLSPAGLFAGCLCCGCQGDRRGRPGRGHLSDALSGQPRQTPGRHSAGLFMRDASPRPAFLHRLLLRRLNGGHLPSMFRSCFAAPSIAGCLYWPARLSAASRAERKTVLKSP